MEAVYYQCKTCGFTHQVPAYWTEFAPDEVMEMPHINLSTKDMCPDQNLHLIPAQ